MTDRAIEDLLRELTPQVLGSLVRRFRNFDAAEDAVQEALLAAATQWPSEGIPANPRGWLITVGARRLTDFFRSDGARREREVAVAIGDRSTDAPAADQQPADGDDTLKLLFMCCHPALTGPSQVSLTLRAVGGLTTDEIAKAFFVPESTMAQRISRAKQTIKKAGATFRMPDPAEWDDRLAVVLHVLYLVFNEGYTASSGADLHRTDLTAEAIRLARNVHRLLPDDGEVAGLLGLMLLTDARRAARTDADGALVPLAEQDRSRWNREFIAEGAEIVRAAWAAETVGPYLLQAAIAAVHDEAPTADDTDWKRVAGLYEMLEQAWDSPMVRLNRAVAVAMVSGPAAGLHLLDTLEADQRVAEHHRLSAVRGHLLEMAGESAAAESAYREAAARTGSERERDYLLERAGRLSSGE